MTENTAKNISVYAEASPNPESMKFVLNQIVLPDGVSVDYPNVEAAGNSPFAQELFNFDYVSRLFIASNFVTITKNSTDTWSQLIPELRTFIKSYLEAGGPVFLETPTSEKKTEAAPENQTEEDAAISKKVIDLLENYVRPAVEQDGGAITYHSFQDGIVKVKLQGSCSGCPSSMITLKAGIENLFTRMMPGEVKAVEALA